jgi:hypothetical protein
MTMTRRHAGEDFNAGSPPAHRVAKGRQPKVHYGYERVGSVMALCQVWTGAVMHSPQLQAHSSRVTCNLCRFRLGMLGAPIP